MKYVNTVPTVSYLDLCQSAGLSENVVSSNQRNKVVKIEIYCIFGFFCKMSLVSPKFEFMVNKTTVCFNNTSHNINKLSHVSLKDMEI